MEEAKFPEKFLLLHSKENCDCSGNTCVGRRTVLVVNSKVLAVEHCGAAAWGNAGLLNGATAGHSWAQKPRWRRLTSGTAWGREDTALPGSRQKERKGKKQQREHEGQSSRRCFVVEESCFQGVLQLVEEKQGEGKWCLIKP